MEEPEIQIDYRGYCQEHSCDVWYSEYCITCQNCLNKPDNEQQEFKPGCTVIRMLPVSEIVTIDNPGGLVTKNRIYKKDPDGNYIREEKKEPAVFIKAERPVKKPQINRSRYGYRYLCPKCGWQFSPNIFESVWEKQYNDDPEGPSGGVFCPICDRAIDVRRVKIKKTIKGRLKKLREKLFGMGN